jgi:hypothetical protein
MTTVTRPKTSWLSGKGTLLSVNGDLLGVGGMDGMGDLGRAGARKPRRESFRPRASVLPAQGGDVSGIAGMAVVGEMEELQEDLLL